MPLPAGGFWLTQSAMDLAHTHLHLQITGAPALFVNSKILYPMLASSAPMIATPVIPQAALVAVPLWISDPLMPTHQGVFLSLVTMKAMLP